MSPRNLSPAREASPRHRKRGFVRPSRRTRGFLADYHDEIVANVEGNIQNAPLSSSTADETVIIQKLEQKRLELDAQIAQYISEKQKEYDATERELYQSISKTDEAAESNALSSKEPVDKSEVSRGRSTMKSKNLSLPSSQAIWAPHAAPQDSPEDGENTMGTRTPTHEREREFHGLFTPIFLPLLDAGGSRSNSAPPVPNAAADGSPDATQGYQSDSSGRQQVRRAVTESFVKSALSKKSALRSPKKSADHKKRVSLIIDDEIVRPSESPKDTHLHPTPTDDQESEMPNVAITDHDGSPIHVWVPEKARLPYPNENALDYVVAVGGTLYRGADVPENHPAAGKLFEGVSKAPKDNSEGAPLQRFPSDSLHSANTTNPIFAWSPPQNENVFQMSPDWDRNSTPKQAILIDEPKKHSATSRDPPTISSPEAPSTSPKEQPQSLPPKRLVSATSPPRSPRSSLSASFSRHPPSYIDKFSTTSNRVFGNVADVVPTTKEAGLAYMDDGGPSSSYVGGLGGSGIDDVDMGSAGYPSSLGASYMEQFAAARAMDQRAKLREEKEKKEQLMEDALEEPRSNDDRPEDEGLLGDMEDF